MPCCNDYGGRVSAQLRQITSMVQRPGKKRVLHKTFSSTMRHGVRRLVQKHMLVNSLARCAFGVSVSVLGNNVKNICVMSTTFLNKGTRSSRDLADTEYTSHHFDGTHDTNCTPFHYLRSVRVVVRSKESITHTIHQSSHL